MCWYGYRQTRRRWLCRHSLAGLCSLEQILNACPTPVCTCNNRTIFRWTFIMDIQSVLLLLIWLFVYQTFRFEFSLFIFNPMCLMCLPCYLTFKCEYCFRFSVLCEGILFYSIVFSASINRIIDMLIVFQTGCSSTACPAPTRSRLAPMSTTALPRNMPPQHYRPHTPSTCAWGPLLTGLLPPTILMSTGRLYITSHTRLLLISMLHLTCLVLLWWV